MYHPEFFLVLISANLFFCWNKPKHISRSRKALWCLCGILKKLFGQSYYIIINSIGKLFCYCCSRCCSHCCQHQLDVTHVKSLEPTHHDSNQKKPKLALQAITNCGTWPHHFHDVSENLPSSQVSASAQNGWLDRTCHLLQGGETHQEQRQHPGDQGALWWLVYWNGVTGARWLLCTGHPMWTRMDMKGHSEPMGVHPSPTAEDLWRTLRDPGWWPLLFAFPVLISLSLSSLFSLWFLPSFFLSFALLMLDCHF